jgi:hypothetical protein
MVVLIGAGLLAVAAPASARSAQQSVIPAMAGTTTVFDLNGIYTDLGSVVQIFIAVKPKTCT